MQGKIREFKKKNDFRCEAWYGNKLINYMAYVDTISAYADWLNKEGFDWRVINVFARRTGRYLTRYYSHEPVPKRPPE